MIQYKRPVIFCGENPGITFYAPGSDQIIAVASYWVCTYAAAGPGHALMIWADPTYAAANGAPAPFGVYSDNPPLARMLAGTLTQYFEGFEGRGFADCAVIDAKLSHWSAADGTYRASCRAGDLAIELVWSELLDCKQLSWPDFPAGPRRFELTTAICPCARATIVLNGTPVPGEIKTGTVDGKPASSAFLAFAETWVEREL